MRLLGAINSLLRWLFQPGNSYLVFRVVLTSLHIFLVTGCATGATPEPERPFFAVWRDTDGERMSPCLRIAFWDDGKVLYDSEAPKWSGKLRTGTLRREEVERLKRALQATPVFQIKDDAHTMPDGPIICLMVRLGKQEQVLYWDEIESSNTGIDLSPTEAKTQFKQCWKMMNQLALDARPQESKKVEEPFRPPPRTWYGKR